MKCHHPSLAANRNIGANSAFRWSHLATLPGSHIIHRTAVLLGLIELAMGRFSFHPVGVQQTLA